MSAWPASVSRTETARRDRVDGARATSPARSARATRWETAPAVISVLRAISRVVSSYGGPDRRITLSRSSVDESMPSAASVRRRSSASIFAIRHTGVMISIDSVRAPGSSRCHAAAMSAAGHRVTGSSG